MFSRARFPHLSARKCRGGVHFFNGFLAETRPMAALWEEMGNGDIILPYYAKGRMQTAQPM